jgi:hypothetical protein
MTSTWALGEESATAAIEAAWFLAGDELDRLHEGTGDGAPGAEVRGPTGLTNGADDTHMYAAWTTTPAWG